MEIGKRQSERTASYRVQISIILALAVIGMCAIMFVASPASAAPSYPCTPAVAGGGPVYVAGEGWWECRCLNLQWLGETCYWAFIPDAVEAKGTHSTSSVSNNRRADVNGTIFRGSLGIGARATAMSGSLCNGAYFCWTNVSAGNLQTYLQLHYWNGSGWNLCRQSGWNVSSSSQSILSTTLTWGEPCGPGYYGMWGGAAQWNGSNAFNIAWSWSGYLYQCSVCRLAGTPTPPPSLPSEPSVTGPNPPKRA